MNVPALKGIHNAVRSGIAAGEAVADALAAGRSGDRLAELQGRVMAGDIGAELFRVRNVKPLWSRFGRLGVPLAGLDMWANTLLRVSPFGTLPHRKPDHAALRPIVQVSRRKYDRPDGRVGFDRPSSVFLANIAHDEDQPVHLRLADPAVPTGSNLATYGEPAPLYCPAGVYELARDQERPVFRIHAANCVHCKTCDIKDPAQNITWVPPEGGSGPNYAGM